jgi:hypothetical protein
MTCSKVSASSTGHMPAHHTQSAPELVGALLVHWVDPPLIQVHEEHCVAQPTDDVGTRPSTTCVSRHLHVMMHEAKSSPCTTPHSTPVGAPRSSRNTLSRCSVGILITNANRSSMIVLRNLRLAPTVVKIDFVGGDASKTATSIKCERVALMCSSCSRATVLTYRTSAAMAGAPRS